LYFHIILPYPHRSVNRKIAESEIFPAKYKKGSTANATAERERQNAQKNEFYPQKYKK